MKNIIFAVLIFISFSQITFGQNDEKPKTISFGVVNDRALVLPLPVFPLVQDLVAETVTVQIKIDLQKGEVVSTQAITGHPLLRPGAESAARGAKFRPVLTEFPPFFGMGFLVYKIEDFTGKVVENETARFFPIITGGIVNGRARVLPKPKYPKEAGSICAMEKIEIVVLIDMAGEVIAAKAVSGAEILRKAAEDAALKTKFAPTLITTSPIYVKGKIVYHFIPAKSCKKPRSKS